MDLNYFRSSGRSTYGSPSRQVIHNIRVFVDIFFLLRHFYSEKSENKNCAHLTKFIELIKAAGKIVRVQSSTADADMCTSIMASNLLEPSEGGFATVLRKGNSVYWKNRRERLQRKDLRGRPGRL